MKLLQIRFTPFRGSKSPLCSSKCTNWYPISCWLSFERLVNLSAISTRIYSVRATYEELCGRQEKPILTYTFRSCMLTDELTDDQSSLLGKSFSLVFFLLLTRGVWYEKKYIKIFKKPVEGPQEVVKRGILVHSRVLHITIYWQYVLDFFLSIRPYSEVLAARPPVF